MTYLDYLPDTPYEDLPASAKTEVTATEYARLQVLAGGLAEPTGLPNALGLALAAKVSSGNILEPRATSTVAKTSSVNSSWRLAAVVSAISFLGLFTYIIFSSASAKTSITPTPKSAAPQTIERLIIQRDTVQVIVRDTIVRYKTKVEIQEVRDTIYLRRDIPIASVATPIDSSESRVASKSLSTGFDWGELTVRGVGNMGGE